MLIQDIHQVEITSRCNLRCKYCLHPTMSREKVDMDVATYERVLHWVSYMMIHHDQKELNLAGIGESTMHGQFLEYVEQARKVLGWGIDLTMATNGLLMTAELAKELAQLRVRVWVSLHRPERAALAVTYLQEVGILQGVSIDPSIASTDWAGQVKWRVSTQNNICDWLPNGKVFVTSRGEIVPCSFDGHGRSVLGTVFDDVTTLQTGPYELCKTCHMKPLIKEASRATA